MKSLLIDATPLTGSSSAATVVPSSSHRTTVGGEVKSTSAAPLSHPLLPGNSTTARIAGQGQESATPTNGPVAIPTATTVPSQAASNTKQNLTTGTFLKSLGLDHLVELFDKEQVCR